MLVDDDSAARLVRARRPARPANARPVPAPPTFSLRDAVADLHADEPVTTLLRRLLGHTERLLTAVGGSVSLVHPAEGSYIKLAERGIPCRLGHAFPLDEGATGRAFASRRPVVIDRYRGVRQGHIPAGHLASEGAAAAVPMWWRGEVIAVTVAFAGRRRRFTTPEIDAFEALTQSAAPAMARSGLAFTPPAAAAAEPPTERERQVLHLIALGLPDREIAVRLGISPKTVEKHVGALLRKTGTHSRAAAAVRATGWGWLAAALATPFPSAPA